jgi:DNA polymerase-4
VATLERLTESLCEGLAERSGGRTVVLKIRTVPWKTHTRSRTLPHPTADRDEILRVATELLYKFGPPAPVRLIGVGVSGLESTERESGLTTTSPPLFSAAANTAAECEERAQLS